MTFLFVETECTFQGVIEYNTALFDKSTIVRMARHYQHLLGSALAHPAQSVTLLSWLSASEQHQLCCQPRSTFPPSPSMHARFEYYAAARADTIAVVYEADHVTYAFLNQRANDIAHRLQTYHIGPEQRVALCVECSLTMVEAILGVLKAGGVYVPLDPAYPTERLQYMLNHSQAHLVLTVSSLIERLPAQRPPHICLDTEGGVLTDRTYATNPVQLCHPDQLAYIIYTSGSTGQPKGVQVSHYQITRLFLATEEWFTFTPEDRWTLFHSYAFDFSVWEFWGALAYGGRLVMVPHCISRSPTVFSHLVVSQGITILNQTPSAFRQFVHSMLHVHQPHHIALRAIIWGGEALEFAHVRPWVDQYGVTQPRLINMYGITETTVHVTYRPLTIADVHQRSGSMIGHPISDLDVLVLDTHQQILPIGVPGELYVGGSGVTRGYLYDPALTATRFLPHPFSVFPGERLYRTGDGARRLDDGDLEYLGRIDKQVKIRGFRIELGEIEMALNQHPLISTCKIILQTTTHEPRLIGYYVSTIPHTPTTSELRQYLLQTLPEYMIPAVFVWLEALPLTLNGKLDEQALPIPATTRPTLADVYIAPRTDTEQQLVAIWQDLLQIEQIGVHDNFFDLGGHSLLVVHMHERVCAELDVSFELITIFQHPTISALAHQLTHDNPPLPMLQQSQHRALERKKSRRQRMQDRRKR